VPRPMAGIFAPLASTTFITYSRDKRMDFGGHGAASVDDGGLRKLPVPIKPQDIIQSSNFP
jgi:hypothetical protein